MQAMYKIKNLYLLTASRIQLTRKYFGTGVLETILKMPNNTICGLPRKHLTNVEVEVVGSGAPGIPTCVVINTNASPYIINCGEGSLKLANEYKLKLHKAPAVFITHPSWRNISGLAGLALAMQEARYSELHVHGSTEIEDIFSVANRFIKLRNLKVKVHRCLPYGEFSDGALTVKYIHLHSSLASLNDSDGFFKHHKHAEESSSSNKKKRDKSLERSVQNVEENKELRKTCLDTAFSFIFTTKSTPGSLILEKCIDYGVPPGPLLGLLKNGRDVTLDNGTVVKSTDVTRPAVPGVSFIAVECPSEDFLDSLLEEKAFCDYQTTKNPASLVIHFTKASVVKNSRYQQWISCFPKSTLHLFINEENKRTGSIAAYRQQYKLNLVQPQIYPELPPSDIPDFPRTDNTIIPVGHSLADVENKALIPFICPIYSDEIFFSCNDNNFIEGETLCKVQLKPKYSYDYSRSLVLKKDEIMEEINEYKDDIEESIKEIRKMEKTLCSSSQIYPKVVFLGTGSSRPSKVRNGSGILVFVNENDCFILDCAESTYSQMIKLYGLEKTYKILRNLHVIYVSHMHIDHHWGLLTLLKERKTAFDKLNELSAENSGAGSSKSGRTDYQKVYILAPVQLYKWLHLFADKFEDISHLYEIIPNTEMRAEFNTQSTYVKHCKELLGLEGIFTTPVVHCPGSFGISLIHKEGWKITYSGDTRPCQALINLGMNSDILIHEATFENDYIEEARLKQHTTTEEAIEVGRQMNVKYILLTHFSQRYCYLPTIEGLNASSNVGIAFDLMEVPYNLLPLLPYLIKPLQLTLSKYDEMNKVATEKIRLRRERKKTTKMIQDDLDSPIPNKIQKFNV